MLTRCRLIRRLLAIGRRDVPLSFVALCQMRLIHYHIKLENHTLLFSTFSSITLTSRVQIRFIEWKRNTTNGQNNAKSRTSPFRSIFLSTSCFCQTAQNATKTGTYNFLLPYYLLYIVSLPYESNQGARCSYNDVLQCPNDDQSGTALL